MLDTLLETKEKVFMGLLEIVANLFGHQVFELDLKSLKPPALETDVISAAAAADLYGCTAFFDHMARGGT